MQINMLLAPLKGPHKFVGFYWKDGTELVVEDVVESGVGVASNGEPTVWLSDEDGVCWNIPWGWLYAFSKKRGPYG